MFLVTRHLDAFKAYSRVVVFINMFKIYGVRIWVRSCGWHIVALLILRGYINIIL